MELWRISNFETLTGEGGLRYAGRWHSAGRPVVYLAESPAGALLEVLVHLELTPEQLPQNYTLLRVESPEGLRPATLDVPAGDGWKLDLASTRSLGDSWLKDRETALARVPSALLPHTFNVLLNPAHLDAGRLRVAESTRIGFDARLLRQVSG